MERARKTTTHRGAREVVEQSIDIKGFAWPSLADSVVVLNVSSVEGDEREVREKVPFWKK